LKFHNAHIKNINSGDTAPFILLRNASLADALTGLYNRRGFELLAGQQLKAAARTAQVLNLVFVDMTT